MQSVSAMIKPLSLNTHNDLDIFKYMCIIEITFSSALRSFVLIMLHKSKQFHSLEFVEFSFC